MTRRPALTQADIARGERDVLPFGALPRGLNRVEASAYIGVSVEQFDELRAAGCLPSPKAITKDVVLWDSSRLYIDEPGSYPAPAPPRPDYESLEWAQHRDRAAPSGCKVYFIGSTGGGVKIGYSTSPHGRLASLQAGSFHKLSVLGMMPGERHVEGWLHRHFAKDRVHSEWFKLTKRLRAFIAEHRE